MPLTFFWGKTTEIIFPGWPGESFGGYISALVLVFVISLLVEWLSHARLVKLSSSNVLTDGLLQTLMYAMRIALAYLVMLAVMCLNIGVLVAAVAGYSVGFLVFGSQVFRKLRIEPYQDLSDLPPLNC
ncbi:copper transporter 6-like [Mangifera indica]|uniref:copper transporter 6-like n=1 Tax=Mangifera indica TaxID=29780 RepID=UPI001CFAFC66|nr:copper transporter 6-like [Mangifera indica]